MSGAPSLMDETNQEPPGINAVSSFTAQNIGAERKDRVVMGLHAASKMVIVCSVVICFFLEVFSHSMIMLFLGNEGTQIALFTGIGYLTFMGWFFCFIGFKMAVDLSGKRYSPPKWKGCGSQLRRNAASGRS